MAKQMVTAVKKGDVSSVLPMIAEKARATWNRLPQHTRNWYTLNDLMSDGVNFTVTKVVKHYRASEGAKFSTYLYAALDNFYINKVVALTNESRGGKQPYALSFDSGLVKVTSSSGANGFMSVESYLARNQKLGSHEERVVSKVDAERAFLKVYQAATPLLRKYIIRWLLQPKITKFKNGSSFRIASVEFRKLSVVHHFTFELCSFIVDDEQTRLDLCKTILAKRFFTYRGKKATGQLRDCEEWALVQLTSVGK